WSARDVRLLCGARGAKTLFGIIGKLAVLEKIMTRCRIVPGLIVLFLAIPIVAQIPQEKVDLDAIYRIKDEGLNRSQVMDTASYLTDVYGARLTGSPQIKAAAEWTQKKLNAWELVNVHLEKWGPFGRGWSNEKLAARAISPESSFPVIVYP